MTEPTDEQLLYRIAIEVYGEGILKESARPKKLTLDLMHEAEKTLDDSNLDMYRHRLRCIVADPSNVSKPIDNYIWHATARQRAIAFCMVMEGK
jgi:hypothetical protein